MEKRSSSRDAFSNWRVLFGISLSSVGVFLALLALSVNSSSTARAAEANQSPKPIVIYSVHNDVSPAMRDVDPWPDVRVQEHEAAANWRVWTGSHKDQPDLVVQKRNAYSANSRRAFQHRSSILPASLTRVLFVAALRPIPTAK